MARIHRACVRGVVVGNRGPVCLLEWKKGCLVHVKGLPPPQQIGATLVVDGTIVMEERAGLSLVVLTVDSQPA